MGFSPQVQSNQTTGQPSGFIPPSPQINPNPFDGGSGNMPESSNGLPKGKNSSFTYSPTSGQQAMGSPNPYPNTIGMGDNQGNQPMPQVGKGKGQ